MEIAVLAKVVPRSGALKVDAGRRRLVREGVDLVLNPFDQRALRVGLELRQPGERVTVVSIGPPPTRHALVEALAVGADRVVLVSDAALAGSDTLATARTLAAALRRVGADLVIAGARSTDSDTGQVPAEVAELLGIPVLTEARSVRRETGPLRFEVTVDTPTGWATYRRVGPLVVGVGEKITKPLKVPTGAALPPEARVETMDLGSIGADPARVGVAGSPTVVEAIGRAAPARSPEVFSAGPVSDRIDAAMRSLARRLPASAPPVGRYGPVPEERRAPDEVIVLANGSDGDLESSALGLVAEVRRGLPGLWPSVAWVGSGPTEASTYRLERAGALGGWFVPTETRLPDSGGFARALDVLLRQRPEACAVLFLSEPFGRDVAGRLAARRGLGLVGDATGVRRDPVHGLVFSKPSFGGDYIADVTSRTRPVLATVRPGVFAPPPDGSETTGFGWSTLPRVGGPNDLERLSEGHESSASAAGLARRDVLVAVGMGIGGPDGIARLEGALDRWNAGLVATRRVVDAGWVPRQQQLGLTGHSFAPRLAVLLGVSGSANHMVGWRRAAVVLAVNSDPAAPVFADSDAGVVGSVDEVVPQLIEPLARLLRS